MIHHRDYTNATSGGHEQLKRSAKTVSVLLYLFMVALLTSAILIITR
jgi:hypothetical protein